MSVKIAKSTTPYAEAIEAFKSLSASGKKIGQKLLKKHNLKPNNLTEEEFYDLLTKEFSSR